MSLLLLSLPKFIFMMENVFEIYYIEDINVLKNNKLNIIAN